MDNMKFYNQKREVPVEAQKKIQAGKLKGYTDINPQWRIMALTELFGPCGLGWYTEITQTWTERGANDEIMQFVTLKLFVKYDKDWSKGIEGTGGSTLVNNFTKGLQNNDEALKMAETDAISVACKKLGIAANIYFANDRTKYSNVLNSDNQDNINLKVTEPQLKRYYAIAKAKNINIETLDDLIKVAFNIKSKKDWLQEDYKKFTDFMESDKGNSTTVIHALEEKIRKREQKNNE